MLHVYLTLVFPSKFEFISSSELNIDFMLIFKINRLTSLKLKSNQLYSLNLFRYKYTNLTKNNYVISETTKT